MGEIVPRKDYGITEGCIRQTLGNPPGFQIKGDDFEAMDKAWDDFEGKHATQTDESVIRLKAMVKVAFAMGYELGLGKGK